MGRLLYRGLSENGVYPIYSQNFFKHTSASASSQSLNSLAFHVNKINKWLLWHHRLGHPSDNIFGTTLSFTNSSDVFNKNSLVTHCKHCLSGKIHKLPFNKSDFQSTKSFELIHSDV